MAKKRLGAIDWADLTVDDADRVRDFYQEVVGWEVEGVTMGDYQDYCMKPPEGSAVAGVCHARGGNSDLPATWLIYINVEDLDQSMDACRRLGGNVIAGPKVIGGHGKYCVIKDPAGAFCALFEPVGPGAEK